MNIYGITNYTNKYLWNNFIQKLLAKMFKGIGEKLLGPYLIWFTKVTSSCKKTTEQIKKAFDKLFDIIVFYLRYSGFFILFNFKNIFLLHTN